MRALHRSLIAASLFALAACADDFEPQSRIARVRVLGVRSQPAEITIPPEGGIPNSVQLDALAVAPQGRAVTVKFAFCRPFANAFAADFECPGKDGVDLPDGNLNLLDPKVLALLGGGAPDGSGAPANPFADPALQAQLAQGLKLNVGYIATDGTEGDRGVERGVGTVFVRASTTPNRNPEVSDLQFAGTRLEGSSFPVSTPVELTPIPAADAQESYLESGVTKQEAISWSWFTTSVGAIEELRSVTLAGGGGESSTVLTTPDQAEEATLWVVARDGRGGIGWRSARFRTLPK